MNEQEHAGKIVRFLDESAARLPWAVTSRLELARRTAVARLTAARARPRLAWPQLPDMSGLPNMVFAPRIAIPLVAGLLALTAAVMIDRIPSNHYMEVAEADEVLLIDELPLNAYLDEGFEQWVALTSEE